MQVDVFRLPQHFAEDTEALKELQDLGIRTFTRAFAHLNDPQNFQQYIDDAFSLEQLKREVNSPGSDFFIIKDGQEAIGYMKTNAGKAQTEPRSDDWMEIERIYVDHRYQGKGLGMRLMAEAEELARSSGKKGLWLGVWDQNKGALGFYEGMNFTIAGTHLFLLGNEPQTDLILEKIL